LSSMRKCVGLLACNPATRLQAGKDNQGTINGISSQIFS